MPIQRLIQKLPAWLFPILKINYMKNALLILLVFMGLNVFAQLCIGDKAASIFASNQYTLTINGAKGLQTYSFEKRKTIYSVAWFLTKHNHPRKVIWDNYQKLQSFLLNNVYIYYSYGDTTKHNIPNYVTYTLSSKNQKMTFEAPYINVLKTLRHVEWKMDPQHFHGSTSFRQHG